MVFQLVLRAAAKGFKRVVGGGGFSRAARNANNRVARRSEILTRIGRRKTLESRDREHPFGCLVERPGVIKPAKS